MKHIFVVGLDAFNLEQLQALPGADAYRFHALLTYDDVKRRDVAAVTALIESGPRRLARFSKRIDAVVGYWDSPSARRCR